ncbi:MAG: ectoine hydroxylase [Burkholderiales bacterium]|nr:ectoine hydroxylase [Burkholderiales bacterium]
MAPITDAYESRAAKDAAIIIRRDPVVYTDLAVDTGSGVSRYQLEAYKRDGFMMLEKFFSARETEALLEEVGRMVEDPEIARREEAICEPGSNVVRSVFKVHAINRVLSRLSRDRRLVNIAKQIVGSEVYIHQSRANLKPGLFGKEFFWHSDFETWHVEDGMPNMRAVSCSILLTDNTDSNGPLMIMGGSHHYFISCIGETPHDHYKESLRKQEYGVPDPDSLRFLADQGEIRSMTAPAGSVVFFDCNAMHGSNSNISPYPRCNLFFVFNSIENTLSDPRHGLNPRPEFIATRQHCTAIKAVDPGYLRDVSKRNGD